MIELTPEQRRAMDRGEPVRVIDPATDEAYVVLRADAREGQAGMQPEPSSSDKSDIPAALLRSAQAFWRDLPDLLKSRRNRGRWVAYHGDARIGIARQPRTLIRECVRRGIAEGQYHLDVIEERPHPPWHVEDVEYGLAEFQQEPGPLAP